MTGPDSPSPLELRGLRVTVPDGDRERVLLDDLDLTVGSGEIVVLTGASGSGKSTLLAIAGLLRRAGIGDVVIAGHPTRDLSERRRGELRGTRIGIIYQSANLLPSLTATEQLELVFHIAGRSRAEGRERAAELLEVVGLTHRADALPRHLSGGERQRVGVARALMAEPDVLLADEPTASLDPELTDDVIRLIADEVHDRGIGALLVTHDDAPLAVADRHVHLEHRGITEMPISRS